MRSFNQQTDDDSDRAFNDTDHTAFETFVQQRSADLSGTAPEQPSTTFTIGGWLQSQSSFLQDI